MSKHTSKPLREQVRELVEADPRTQKQIAEDAGVNDSLLCGYLTGRRDMRGETIDKLLAVLRG